MFRPLAAESTILPAILTLLAAEFVLLPAQLSLLAAELTFLLATQKKAVISIMKEITAFPMWHAFLFSQLPTD